MTSTKQVEKTTFHSIQYTTTFSGPINWYSYINTIIKMRVKRKPSELPVLTIVSTFFLVLLSQWSSETTKAVEGFTLFMMGGRKSTGNLKRALMSGEKTSSSRNKKGKKSSLQQRQEITGVTLPVDGMMKGWEFGNQTTLTCANVGGKFYAVSGECPRCAFELWKGEIVTDPAFEDLPRVACPTCATTFGLRSGKYGPPIRRTGLTGFVNGLAKAATAGDKPKDTEAYEITLEEDGRVYCRKR
jgi:nitrite reductase/ring-hydroxylating ferredoxin subunit